MKLKIQEAPRARFFFLVSLKHCAREEPPGAWEGRGMDGWMDGCPRPKAARAVIETRSPAVCEPDCRCKACRALLARLRAPHHPPGRRKKPRKILQIYIYIYFSFSAAQDQQA